MLSAKAAVGKARAKNINNITRLILIPLAGMTFKTVRTLLACRGSPQRLAAQNIASPLPVKEQVPTTSVQVSYQAGSCGDTENKRSRSGRPYEFCFNGVQGVAAKANESAVSNHLDLPRDESLRSL